MRAKGFTLVELMIVVALIGILSAVALAGYNDYIKTSNTAVVHNHFEQAIRAVRWEYSNSHAAAANGVDLPAPATADGWIEKINGNEGRAPGGGLAYTPGTGSSGTGAIGISVSGTWEGGDSTVTITRPIFNDLPLRAESVSM